MNLAIRHDEEGDAGGERPDAVDRTSGWRAAAASQMLPVHDHAGLREGEGEEGADGEQRE